MSDDGISGGFVDGVCTGRHAGLYGLGQFYNRAEQLPRRERVQSISCYFGRIVNNSVPGNGLFVRFNHQSNVHFDVALDHDAIFSKHADLHLGNRCTCNTALQSEFFTIPNTAGGAIIPRLRLSTNDNTTTAWNGQTLQVDLWSTYPTFQTTGDRGAFITDFLTGSAAHLGAYTCVMAGTANTAYGDGTYAECTSNAGNATIFKLASGTSVYWTLQAVTGSYGVTGASKVFTLTVEELN